MPLIPRWKDIFANAVPRPRSDQRANYNEVSARFWSAVHDTLSGTGTGGREPKIWNLT